MRAVLNSRLRGNHEEVACHPVAIAGGGSVGIKLGNHLQCKAGTPLANSRLTQLQALGIKTDQYADSTGPLSPVLR